MKRLIITVALIGLLINPCGAVSIIPRSQEYWTCVDYSMDFAKNNPDWGTVSIAQTPNFLDESKSYDSHMVNYKIIDNNTMEIHDGMYKLDYTSTDWKNDGQYYHFWLNGKPLRNYRYLYDNRDELPQ